MGLAQRFVSVRGLSVLTAVALATFGTAAAEATERQTAAKKPIHDLRFRPVLAELPGSTGVATSSAAEKDAVRSCDSGAVSALGDVANTPRADDETAACVVLPHREDKELDPIRYFLGPAQFTEKAVRGAKTEFVRGQGYVVSVRLTKAGVRKLNELAVQLLPKRSPENEIAIVVDGVVQSAPSIQATDFGDLVEISGMFTKEDASDLARVVNLARRS